MVQKQSLEQKHENIKLSTKTTNLIEACTCLKKALRIGKFFFKHKLSCAEMLRHNIKNLN